MSNAFTQAGVLTVLMSSILTNASEPVLVDSFDEGATRWEFLDPDTWRHTGGDDPAVEITARDSAYRPPFRSPFHVALVKDCSLGDVDISFRVRSLIDTGAHRDCCIFFGWQDPSHFYYAHLGARPDPHSGQVLIVNGADRVALTTNTTPIPWTDGWHTVRLQRRVSDGAIRVYFDDTETPWLTVTDKTFGVGRIGIGSFDDMNAFDDVRIESP